MIKIDQLNKTFGKQRVLNNVSVQFRRGEVVALIGPNGSGKTTLIKSILGLVLPDSGSIALNGVNVENDRNYRRHIGYMPQIGRYPDQMRIREVFSIMRDLRRDHPEVDEELVSEFRLPGMYEKRMSTLSGGTRQKVSACLAFLFDPEVMILDEPTAGLDPDASEILKAKILRKKSKGALTIITTHNMSEVEELADRVVFIVDGVIRFDRPVAAILGESGEVRLGKALAKITEGTAHV